MPENCYVCNFSCNYCLVPPNPCTTCFTNRDNSEFIRKFFIEDRKRAKERLIKMGLENWASGIKDNECDQLDYFDYFEGLCASCYENAFKNEKKVDEKLFVRQNDEYVEFGNIFLNKS